MSGNEERYARDVELLDSMLEEAASGTDDLTHAVYRRFFQIRPDAEKLFYGGDIPRGHMLNEMIFLLLDAAHSKPYVPVTVTSTASDHVAHGIVDPSLYADFFDALREVLAELVGAAWTAEIAATWERQCRVVLEFLRDSDTFAKHRGRPAGPPEEPAPDARI